MVLKLNSGYFIKKEYFSTFFFQVTNWPEKRFIKILKTATDREIPGLHIANGFRAPTPPETDTVSKN